MAHLILPSRFNQQPQYPVEINGEWRDIIIGAWVGSQTNLIEPSGPVPIIANTTTLIARNEGLSRYATTYAGSQLIQLPEEYRFIGKEFSFVAGVRLFGNVTANQYNTIFSVRDNSTTYFNAIYGSDGGNWTGGRFGISSAGSDVIGTSGSAKASRYVI